MNVVKARTRRTVVVTLGTGETFRGVLWEHDRHNVVLHGAVAMLPTGDVPADGELLFTWDRISYLQFP